MLRGTNIQIIPVIPIVQIVTNQDTLLWDVGQKGVEPKRKDRAKRRNNRKRRTMRQRGRIKKKGKDRMNEAVHNNSDDKSRGSNSSYMATSVTSHSQFSTAAPLPIYARTYQHSRN